MQFHLKYLNKPHNKIAAKPASIQTAGRVPQIFAAFAAVIMLFAAVCTHILPAYAAESPSETVTAGGGKLVIDAQPGLDLNLEYDDYYSFSNNPAYSMYKDYVILDINQTAITSSAVFMGNVTSHKDTAAVELDEKNVKYGIHASGTGSAEVILVKEENYEAAKQIADGSYSGGSVQIRAVKISVDVAPARLTLMLLGGQSNMEGHSDDATGYHPENSVMCKRGTVYSSYAPKSATAFKNITGLTGSAANISNMDSFIAGSLSRNAAAINGKELTYRLDSLTADGTGKTGPDSGLAYEWNLLTGDKVWTVNAAFGNSRIEAWDTKSTETGTKWIRAKTAYQYALQTYNAELAANHYSRGSVLFFWLQGESDKSLSVREYQKHFDNFYSELTSAVNLDSFGIITTRSASTHSTPEDIVMTGPRISQRYMSGSFNQKYAGVYIVSDINEQWVTDDGVTNYFNKEYPGGAFTYPLRSSATFAALPKTVEEIHKTIHYSQAAHNENGIDAAYNMYHIINKTNLFDSGSTVKNRDGSQMSVNPRVSVAFADNNGQKINIASPYVCSAQKAETLVMCASPVYMSKNIIYRLAADNALYDEAAQQIISTDTGLNVIYALSPSYEFIASLTFSFSHFSSPDIVYTSCDNGKVTLKWNNTFPYIGGEYRLYRSEDPSVWGAPIAKLLIGESDYTNETFSYSDSNAIAGHHYYYAVETACGQTAGGITAYTKLGYYKAPKLTGIQGTASGIEITWSKPGNIKMYQVFRKDNSSDWKSIGKTSQTNFTDNSVVPNKTYTYTVRCLNADEKTYASGYDTVGLTLKYAETPVIKILQGDSYGIVLKWDPASGAQVYRVFRKTGSESWHAIGISTGTSYRDTDVNPNVLYNYTVRCMDTAEKLYTSGYNTKGVSLKYAADPALKSITGTISGINVKWNTAKGADYYAVFRKSSDSSWSLTGSTDKTAFTDTSAVPGTLYTYTVRCMDAEQKLYTSGFDTEGLSLKYAETPYISDIQGTSNGVSFSWGKAAGADMYCVFKKELGGKWAVFGYTKKTTYTDDSVKAGKTYAYTVRCIDKNKKLYTSGYDADGTSIKYVNKPKLTYVEGASAGVIVKWEAPKGAQAYAVLRKTSSGNWSAVGKTDKTSFTDESALPGKTYFYTVRCMNSSKKIYTSGYDTAGLSVKYAETPVITKIEGHSKGISLSWSKSSGAEVYRVFKKVESGKWTIAENTKNTSFTDNDVSPNTAYSYTVRCINSKKNQYTSGYDAAGTSIKYVSQPKLDSIEGTSSGILIKWKAPKGAQSYAIFKKSSDGSWQAAGTSNKTSYTDSTAVPGKKHTYTVRCMDAEQSAYTSGFDTNGLSIKYAETPKLTKIEGNNNGITVSWSPAIGAEIYRVFRKASGGAWVKLADLQESKTAFTDKNVTPNTIYTYTVRCMDEKKDRFIGGFDKTGVTLHYTAIPVLKSIEAVPAGIMIRWSSTPGAKTYRVFRKTKTESWQAVGSTTELKYTDTSAVSGITYTYTVRCMDENQTTFTGGFDTAGLSLAYAETPKLTAIDGNASGITVKWNPSGVVKYYRVFRRNASGTWSRLVDTSATSFTDRDVKPDMRYTYTVRCMDTDKLTFISGYDVEGLSLKYAETPQLNRVYVTKNQSVKISWYKALGAENYRIMRKSGLTSSWQSIGTTTSTEFTDTSAEPNMTYTYTVRCVDPENKHYTSGYVKKGRTVQITSYNMLMLY